MPVAMNVNQNRSIGVWSWFFSVTWASLLSLLHCQILAAATPTLLQPSDAEKAVKRLPKYVGLGYTGLTFFKGRLYAPCNIGVLEIEEGKVRRAYRWNRRDSVVEGIWLDQANNLAWVWVVGDGRLASFDGRTWKSVPMPQPKSGFVTRGDILEGYRGISGSKTFWLEGAGCVWPWDAASGTWKPDLVLPRFANYGSLVRCLFLENKPCVIARYEPGWNLVNWGELASRKGDSVHFLDGSWQEITNRTGQPFFVEATVTAGDGYMRTIDGHVLQIHSGQVSRVSSPGFCEALVVTTSGTLLAEFRNLGIYEFTDRWRCICKAPFESQLEKRWVHLAEDRGTIAVAFTRWPGQKITSSLYDLLASIWILRGENWQPVPFAAIQPTAKEEKQWMPGGPLISSLSPLP
jgi:hypothetical protein